LTDWEEVEEGTAKPKTGKSGGLFD
jgi:hypothetical protein